MTRVLLPAIAALSLVVSAQAGLRWETLEKRVSADPEERAVTVPFAFVNDGTTPVRVTGVKTNCGCTGAKPDHNPIAPGERAEIAITFKFGDRKGAYSTPVTVKTDDPAAPETKLNLIVDIIPPAELSPQFFFWKKDEPLSAKQGTLRRTGKDEITAVDVGATGATPSGIHLEPVKKGDEYRVSVDPAAFTESPRAEIPVQVHFASGKQKAFALHVRVR